MNVLSDIGRMASAMAESVSAFVNANKSLSYGAGGAVLMAVLAGMLWPGDQDVTGPDMADVSLSGSWKVSYTDRVLGAVEGSALVSEDESSVTVRLVHPTTEARMTLQSNVVSRAGNTLNITLRGEGPSVQNLVDSAVGQYLDVGEGTPYQSQGPDQIILSMGEASMRVTVREPAQASVQEIKLELTIGREALTGNWTQIVNPETGRDQNNRGRIGELAYLDDGTGRARQSGRESWRRPKPIIHMAVVHADQYAQSLTGSAAYPYPWNDDGTAAAAPYSQRRHILVLGEDLPTELGETATFTSTNPNVEYFLSLKPSNLRFFPASGYMIDRAWARIENNLRQQMLAVSPNGVISPAGEAAIAQTLNELHELDFVLVRAQLAEGAVPGKTEFTLNGTTANWSLGYGDYNGSFAFARPLPAGPDEAGISEPLDYAFIPDKIFLEIRTNKQMPFDNVPMQIWLPGEGGKLQPRLFNGKRELTAVRLPITETDRENLEYRKRRVRETGGDPDSVQMLYTYRSPALALVQAGTAPEDQGDIPGVEGDYRIPVNGGDIIRGVFGAPDKFRVTPAIAEMRVVASPSEIAQANLGSAADTNLTWIRAITLAANCVNVPLMRADDEDGNPNGPIDWNATARVKSQTFTNVIVLAAETTSLDMSVGDHAAMLMLRDVFIEMMTRQVRDLEAIDTPAEVAAFRAQSEIPVTSVANHPLADFDITAPNGDPLSFELSFAEDRYLVGKYGLTQENISEWRRTQTLIVIEQYLSEVRRSQVLAQEIDICDDAEELIELTGKGFDGVYRYAMGRLVTLDETPSAPGQYWKPDLVARARLLGIPTFANALSAQEAYSAADTKAVITATAIATSVVGIGGSLLAVGATSLGAAEATGGAVWALGYSVATLSEVGVALSFASDFLTTAYSIGSAATEKYAASSEVTFARGAALTIGMTRLDQAIANDPSYAKVFTNLYIDIAPNILGAAFSADDLLSAVRNFGQASSLSRFATNVTKGGVRTLAQDDAIARGRALLGEPVVSANAGSVTTQLPPFEPPTILASQFADAFPDARAMQGLNQLGVDDLMDPANPNVLRGGDALANDLDTILDGAAPPAPVAGAASDTILDGAAPPAPLAAPDAQFPPPGFDGSATNIDPPAVTAATPPPPTSVDELAGMRTQIDAMYDAAQTEAQGIFSVGGDITGLQATQLTGTAQLHAAQGLLEDAVDVARQAGLADAEINALLAARAGMENPMAARYALIRDLEYAGVQRLGYEILLPHEANELLQIITRAMNTTPDAVPVSALDLDRLKQWIDTYSQRGLDFFDEMQKMGTFSDFVEDAASMNPGAGFEALADADDIAALRSIAEENGLLPDLTETAVVNAVQPGQVQVSNLEEVRALSDIDRISVFAAMIDSRRIALEVGEGALDTVDQVAYRLSQEALNEGVGALPVWARGLDRATYDIIAPLAARADIRVLAEANPGQLSALARDPNGLVALSRRPSNDIAELTADAAKEQRRAKSPLAGFHEQTSPARWDPDDLVLKDEVINMREIDPDLPDVLMSTTKIMVEGDEIGTFARELEFFDLPNGGEGKQMVMSYANGKYAPRFIEEVDVALVPGRGAPLATFMNVRAFHNLGIPYGDPSLLRVKMSTVINANTSIEIDWMRRMYGENFDQYLRHTHSVRYAESALNQAGYRISGVRLEGGSQSTETARALVAGDFFNAVEDPMQFLARYGVDPDATIETGFNIYIDIVPF